jgi:hypothetical protein
LGLQGWREGEEGAGHGGWPGAGGAFWLARAPG